MVCSQSSLSGGGTLGSWSFNSGWAPPTTLLRLGQSSQNQIESKPAIETVTVEPDGSLTSSLESDSSIHRPMRLTTEAGTKPSTNVVCFTFVLEHLLLRFAGIRRADSRRYAGLYVPVARNTGQIDYDPTDPAEGPQGHSCRTAWPGRIELSEPKAKPSRQKGCDV